MKILLINPPAENKKDYIREGRCMQTKSSWASLWMPLSLSYAASLLRENGQEVKIIDCIAEKFNTQNLLAEIKLFSPQMIILSTGFPSINGDMKTAGIIKKNFSEVKILAIGLYPSIREAKFLEEFPQIDYTVIGEPEWAVCNLAKTLDKAGEISEVKGVIFRNGKEIIKNKAQNLNENDVRELPFPARDLLKNEAYKLPTNRQKFTLLNIGRGCPHNCIYCMANIYYGKKFRKRQVENVITEIEECVNKHKIKNFLFWGESFTLDPNYGEQICDEIIRKNIKIAWSTTSRVDTLNERLLSKMKKAGCILLGLGIESADQKILDRAKKGTNLEQIKKAIAMVKRSGIRSMGHFIFGLPGESQKTAAETIRFALKEGVDFAQFYCAIPYPKTELGEIAKNNNWIETNDYSQFDLTKSVMRNEKLSSKEIQEIRDRAYRRFYFRPKMLLQTMREIDSLKSLFSLANFIDWIKAKRK